MKESLELIAHSSKSKGGTNTKGSGLHPTINGNLTNFAICIYLNYSYYTGSKFQGSKFKPARPDYIGTGGSWPGVREIKYSRIIDLKYLLRFEDE